MHLYNALTRTIEPFVPSQGRSFVPSQGRPFVPNGDAVTVYVCGITPYDTTHLGHAFTYTVFDVLIRYLEHRGLSVRYAQNVTDIDDDILRKGREAGEDWQALGNRWTVYFMRDLQNLNVRPPDFYPRATDVIPEIVASVQQLMAAGVAYESAGSVFFHVAAWPAFGKLSHLPRDEMLPIANQRGNLPDDPLKRDPLDFVLWQAQQPGEPAWESPWGPGRPGWHIECSTMSTHLLDTTVDIHGGGGDLIFPHHECEIAQVEPVTGQPFVRFWMHAAMVFHEGEKMSKSLGNLVMVRDLLKTYSPDAIRAYLAMHHYRQSWYYDEVRLREAADLAAHLRNAVVTAGGAKSLTTEAQQAFAAFAASFEANLDNDLDSPKALYSLEDLASGIRDSAAAGYDVTGAQVILRQLGRVFGLRLDAGAPEPRVLDGWANHLQRFV